MVLCVVIKVQGFATLDAEMVDPVAVVQWMQKVLVWCNLEFHGETQM